MLRNGLEPWHLIILLAVLLLAVGGKKLPELARGTGQALRIFKAETSGLTDEGVSELAATSDTSEATPATPGATGSS